MIVAAERGEGLPAFFEVLKYSDGPDELGSGLWVVDVLPGELLVSKRAKVVELHSVSRRDEGADAAFAVEAENSESVRGASTRTDLKFGPSAAV